MSETEPLDDEEQDGEAGVVTVKEVTMDGGEVTLGDSNGEVLGDVLRGGVIRGDGHLIVKGNVLGDPKARCEIEVAETLVLEQRIQHAVVRARHVVVVGDVVESEIHSDIGVEVRSDLDASDVSLGYRSGEIQELKRLRGQFHDVSQQLSEVEVRMTSGSRKFIRDYHQVDLRLGSILTPTQKELKVDLSPFYDALGERARDEESVVKALQEFYLRVVVGVLTRSNKVYVSQNPSRHKIFLKVIEELREYLLAVRRVDHLREKQKALEATREEILESLNKPVPLHLRVSGEVSGTCRIRALNISDVRYTASGAVEMDESWAETKFQEGSNGREFESWSLSGKKSVKPAPDPVKKGQFELKDEIVSWKAS